MNYLLGESQLQGHLIFLVEQQDEEWIACLTLLDRRIQTHLLETYPNIRPVYTNTKGNLDHSGSSVLPFCINHCIIQCFFLI